MLLHRLTLAFGVAFGPGTLAPATAAPQAVGEPTSLQSAAAPATRAVPSPGVSASAAPVVLPSAGPPPNGISSPSASPPNVISSPPASRPNVGHLQLAKTHLELNRDNRSSIAISGGVAPYAVAISAPIADVRIDAVAQVLALRGRANGSGTVTVSDATGAEVSATLLVAPNAGFVPATLDVALVGAPGHDFVMAQIRAALERAAHPFPGVRLTVADYGPAGMRPGERLDAALHVHLDGANRYVDVDGIANVHVVTTAAAPIDPERLFYSDDPERVGSDGVLLQTTIRAGHPVRLYYYHQAVTPNREIGLLLDSPSGSAQIEIVGEGAGPSAAVMYVGQSATYRYLDDRARGAGVVLDVPVGGAVDFATGEHLLHLGELVAGVFDLAVTSGDPVRLTVLSRTPGTSGLALLDSLELASDGKHRRGEYDLARTRPLVLGYRVGDAEPGPTFAVGSAADALPNLRPGGRTLTGDYGLLRPVSLALSNPTNAAATVTLYERPSGYPVTTTLALHGEPAPLRVQCVKDAAKRYGVRSFLVPARSDELVTGSYMTDGASTYPLTFGLTAGDTGALPATMIASDGCFPPAAPAAGALTGRRSAAPRTNAP